MTQEQEKNYLKKKKNCKLRKMSIKLEIKQKTKNLQPNLIIRTTVKLMQELFTIQKLVLILKFISVFNWGRSEE